MGKAVQQLALVDCNNFYVSCERVFRPDLAQVPLVVMRAGAGLLRPSGRASRPGNAP